MTVIDNRDAHVVVVGATSLTGRLLLPELDKAFGKVTSLVREARDLNHHNVLENWTENAEALEAIKVADVVILLTGVFTAPTWAHYKEAIVDPAELVARAIGSRKTRIVYVSSMLASPDSNNWYLKAKGMAEEFLLPLEHYIFRGQPIVSGGDDPMPFEKKLLPQSSEGSVTIFGDGHQRVRPVHIRDVADICLAAALGRGALGTYNFGGPDEFSLLELISLANGREVAVKRMPKEEAEKIPGLKTAADVIETMIPATGSEDTARLFGTRLTSLSTIWPLKIHQELAK